MISEHFARSARHTSHYLAAGPEDGPALIFVHGWPELSISWRHQLPVFAGLGFRAIAPDMRGYGRSSVYKTHDAYAVRESVADMLELLASLGREKAIWVGHDWGSPVVWSLASHHPERCLGVANLCVPYIPEGFAHPNLTQYADRSVYPEAEHPAAQWDYMLFYEENFEAARTAFETNPGNTVRLLFRRGNPDGKGLPAATSGVRARGGWFGPGVAAPELPMDDSVLTQADFETYAEGLARNGFFGPDSWYMNAERNMAYAREAKNGGKITLPTLFLHGAYDYVCETITSRLAEPMRAACGDLREAIVPSGHWMAQEQPAAVNAHLAKWIVEKLPGAWPKH